MSEPSLEAVMTTVVEVHGMHCRNCEVLIERRFRDVPGVRAAAARQAERTVAVTHVGELDIAALQRSVSGDGYSVARSQGGPSPRNSSRDYAEIGAAFAILVGAFLLLRQLDLVPRSIGLSENMSYGLVFLIGLVASVSSCIAVTGGLLVAVAARYNEATGAQPGAKRLKPLLYFNAGRLISYAVLGGAVGALGSALMPSPEATGILTIVASGVMILLGLQMLRIVPAFGGLRMPKAFAHRIHDLAGRDFRGGAFALGAATFFLPCGFTQALQLYVLASGSFATGALTMLAFALGTLPALMSLSALASFARGSFQKHFMRFAGAAVIVFGILNIQYGLVLTGSELRPAAPVAQLAPPTAAPRSDAAAAGPQILVMRVSDYTYEPSEFTVRQGTPVSWRIDASDAADCGRFLLAPGLGIRRILSSNSTTIISFLPRAAGEYRFNCSMGMMSPGRITVLPDSSNG